MCPATPPTRRQRPPPERGRPAARRPPWPARSVPASRVPVVPGLPPARGGESGSASHIDAPPRPSVYLVSCHAPPLRPGWHYAHAVSFRDDFEGHDLDLSVWIPHYLPQWSSRADSAARYRVTGSELRLSIPPEQGLWCPAEHDGPLRVSGIQSGVFSGEVGSTIGQQPFREGAVVREYQPAQWGWTPEYGLIEVRA